MSRNETGSETMPNCSGRFDRIIEILLLSLYGLMPLAMGGVKAWAKEAAILLTGTALLSILLKKLYLNDEKIRGTRAYIPALIFTGIVIIQLIPFPTKITAILSPNTAVLKTQLLNDLAETARPLKTMALSFYSNATKHDLRLILAAFAVFFVVFNYCTNKEKIKRILTLIAYIGGLIAGIALIQNIFGNGKIYWLIEPKSGGTPSGPFVNHSHYGQFMNLSIGAAIGILLAELNEKISGSKKALTDVFEYLGSREARKFWIMVTIIIIGTATVFLSLSRGAMLSMLAAIFFVTLTGISKKSTKGYGWIMAVIGLISFACVVYTSFDAVYERFASLWNTSHYQDRLGIVKDLTVNFRRFPLFGTGMGTHSVVYPMIDSSNLTTLCTHAENEYAQVMEETGLAGLATLIVFGIIILRAFFRNIGSKDTTVRALSYGIFFGLIAILVHSMSDFGQHIPANTFLSVTYCAMLLSLLNIKRDEIETASIKRFNLLRTVVLLICAGIWIWSLYGADNSRKAQAEWQNVRNIEKQLIENNWQGTDKDYNELIEYAKNAVTAEPDNSIYRYWYNVYRWRKECREIGNDWEIFPQQSMFLVMDIVKELDEVRYNCPTFGAAYCVEGQIEYNILEKAEAGLEKIRKGFLLAPCDPVACFVAGAADIEEGDIQQSEVKLKKAVELRENIFTDVAKIYVEKINQPQSAIEIAGENVNRLAYLKQILSADSEQENYAKQVQQILTETLEKECSQPKAPADSLVLLAEIYRQGNEKKSTAAELYRRALSGNYARVEWRLNLARILAESGKDQEAMQEARICLKIRPQFKEAEELICELSVANSR